MLVLALNCGSSSVKCRLSTVQPGANAGADDCLAAVTMDRLTPDSDYELTVRSALRRLVADQPGARIDAVGHRVVHGGPTLSRPVPIDDGVLAAIEAAGRLAPLHNAPALAGIRAARAVVGPSVPMVAVFDTGFHADLPARAATYAIPADLAHRHSLRRFGFHGISYAAALARYCTLTGTPPERATLVALHLGSGCSATAIQGGRSVDTSMGLTPLEGLVMGTRSGDVDPALPGRLASLENTTAETAEEWLNTRSGLLGLSGLTPDVRTLLAEEARHEGARLALEVFCYRARKYVGAYLAALGGAPALVFTGAIGARSPDIRARVCAGMEWAGFVLDPAANAAAVDVEQRISQPGSPASIWVIPAQEESMIAWETARALAR